MLANPYAMPIHVHGLGGKGFGSVLLQRGFTLVELMVGVAIIAIAMAAAVPSFAVWIQNSRIRTAAESVLTGIQLARAEAVRRNAQVFFELSPNANLLWSVGCVTAVAPGVPLACPALIQSREVADGSLVSSGGQLSVTFDAEAGSRIVFDNFGRRVTADFAQLNIGSAVLSAADSRTQRVVVGAGGGVLMCDPKLMAPSARACP